MDYYLQLDDSQGDKDSLILLPKALPFCRRCKDGTDMLCL